MGTCFKSLVQQPLSSPLRSTTHSAMDAIKKKMQAMKLEKDNAMDRADACEQQAKDANLRAEKTPNGPRAGKPCPISTSADHGPLSCPGQQSLPAKLCPIFHNPGEDRSRPDRGSAWRGLLIGSSLVGRWSNQVCRPPATCRVPPDEPWPSPLPPHQPALLTANPRRNAT